MRPNRRICLGLALLLIAAGCARKPAVRTTELHRAAEQGNVKQVESLISRGAKVNALTDEGWTPLDFADRAGFAYTGYKSQEVAEVVRAAGGKQGREVRR